MTARTVFALAAALLLASLLGCGTKEPPPQEKKSEEPKPVGADQQAPAEYAVKLETTKGDVLIDVNREWAPRGADRFYTLVKAGFYDGAAFFRVLDGFMAQTGMNGDPAVTREWRDRRIQDDPVTQSNQRGTCSFATSGPNSRTTQFFINFGDNSKLDSMGFAPFGKVRDMTVVDQLYSGYGEGFPKGNGPSQKKIHQQGNAYLEAEFPKLDYVKTARIVE
jgi:peptidyl-prolyl cis-trans isomerase A (cyclophilin A)